MRLRWFGHVRRRDGGYTGQKITMVKIHGIPITIVDHRAMVGPLSALLSLHVIAQQLCSSSSTPTGVRAAGRAPLSFASILW